MMYVNTTRNFFVCQKIKISKAVLIHYVPILTLQEVFAPFDSCDTPQTSTGAPNAAQEIKKLVVCKDTGETILHRAARLGHLVSTSQPIGGAMKHA